MVELHMQVQLSSGYYLLQFHNTVAFEYNRKTTSLESYIRLVLLKCLIIHHR